ncbi:tonB-system energizer ExbB [Psychrobium sp. MM17-31]|uniref:tonB-system energizer ExbB n=1 Tax=Psychrobium sp. MM17-31 TaxID=2917758 RepID=UPI001EF719BA|nr:tonB-system energizer ExbB [Psychrobium sp. MM17-31]MCG7532316.1 tonB-system energizer ExbB [Psychrobium sp. MM17-31]
MPSKKWLNAVVLSVMGYVFCGAAVANTVTPVHDLSPWGMYLAADAVVKSVMIGLVIASLVTWTILIYKTVQLRRAKGHSERLLTHLIQCESFDNMNIEQQESQAIRLIQACHQEFGLSLNGVVSEAGLKERVNARLERIKASIIAHTNQGTGILATIGSVAPFVGLFGTVWGIMNSFIGIAESQTTNLAVVAPGIAEALLATAMGLVAAIPAVMAYNYFTRVISGYKANLTDISSALMILLSRELDQQNDHAKALKLSIFTSQDEQEEIVESQTDTESTNTETSDSDEQVEKTEQSNTQEVLVESESQQSNKAPSAAESIS